MPTPLPIIDLSAAIVGTTGTIDLTPVAPTSNPAYTQQSAILQVYNESGCGLRLSFRDTLGGTDLPAGGWKDIAVPLGEGAVNYTVVYVLASSLVSKLLATYYLPNEPVPRSGSVGNSPINGGSLSQATSVVQTGQPVPTPVVLATPNASFIPAPGLLESVINNDGTFSLGNVGTAPGTQGQVISSVAAGHIGAAQFGANLGAGVPAVTFLGRAPVQLQTNNQETGYCGASFEVGSSVASAVGPVVNFKCLMTNVPSSITLNTPIENSGASSPGATDINIYGFWLAWTATTANSLSRYTNTYTTVGN